MLKTLALRIIGKPFIKKTANAIAAAFVGAVIAYLVDTNLLDGEGANTLSNALLNFAAQIIETL